MSIIDHGAWVAYKPETPHKDAPLNTIYAKRTSDDVDWYEYVNDPETFQEHSVKFAVIWREDLKSFLIGPATRDATALFPQGHIVYELIGYDGNDPQVTFGNRMFDPETGAFGEISRPTDPMKPLLDRIEALERQLDGTQGKR